MDDAGRSKRQVCNKKRMHAAATMFARSATTGRYVKADKWVKAHVLDDLTKAQLPSALSSMTEVQKRDAYGNKAADEQAKLANEEYELNVKDQHIIAQDAKDRNKLRLVAKNHWSYAPAMAIE